MPTYRVHCPHQQAETRTCALPQAGSAPPTTATHYLERCCATYSPAQCSASSATLPLTSPNAARIATTQGTAPLTGRYTRYVALHLLRGAAPVQNGCIAYISGAAPTLTSKTVEQTTTHANFNTTKRPQHQHAWQTIPHATPRLRATR